MLAGFGKQPTVADRLKGGFTTLSRSLRVWLGILAVSLALPIFSTSLAGCGKSAPSLKTDPGLVWLKKGEPFTPDWDGAALRMDKYLELTHD